MTRCTDSRAPCGVFVGLRTLDIEGGVLHKRHIILLTLYRRYNTGPTETVCF
jgi:hypothetical protein